MNRQVRVAADRRCEVAVVRTREREVLLLERAIDRLLETPQEGVVDGVSLRFVRRLAEDSLKRKAIGLAADVVAEDAGEVGERLELGGVRRRVDAAEERHVKIGEVFRDR